MQSNDMLASGRGSDCKDHVLNPLLFWQLKDKSLLIQAGFIDNTHVKTTASGKRFPVFGKGCPEYRKRKQEGTDPWEKKSCQ